LSGVTTRGLAVKGGVTTHVKVGCFPSVWSRVGARQTMPQIFPRVAPGKPNRAAGGGQKAEVEKMSGEARGTRVRVDGFCPHEGVLNQQYKNASVSAAADGGTPRALPVEGRAPTVVYSSSP
jgi:hypothetical protein